MLVASEWGNRLRIFSTPQGEINRLVLPCYMFRLHRNMDENALSLDFMHKWAEIEKKKWAQVTF